MSETSKLRKEVNFALRELNARRLDSALETAEALVRNHAPDAKSDDAKLLLWLQSKILNSYGYFFNKEEYFEQTISLLSKVNTLSGLTPIEIDLLIEKGIALYSKSQMEEANRLLFKCLNDSQEGNFTKQRIASLLALGRLHFVLNDFDSAIAYAEKALSLLDADSEIDQGLLLETYCQLIQVYLRKHEYPKLKEFSELALDLSVKLDYKEAEIIAMNGMAVYHGSLYDFKTAMQTFLDGMGKSNKIGYRYGTAYCLINIGTIYATLLNYDEALEKYTSVLDSYDDIIDDSTLLIILNNVGNIHFTLGEHDTAKEYFSKSLVMAEEIRYLEMIAHIKAQISRILVEQGQYQEAMEAAMEAETLLIELGDIDGKQINYINLGNIHFKMDKLDEALRHVSKGIVLAKRMNDIVSEIQGYRLTANIFEKKGNFRKAYEYQLIYSKAQESFNLDQRNRHIMHMEIRNEIEKKEREIELLTKYQDILIQQRNEIAAKNDELLDVNDELKRFAYAVSHDLKEPLRMIGSYVQLLAKRYESQIDDNGKTYISFAVDGVTRLTRLLDDLLKYATIGQNSDNTELVSLDDVMEEVSSNLQLSIHETNANIELKNLPSVMANFSLMVQVFQNLTANALKFRNKNRTPHITITGQENKNGILVVFKDNGIGIPQESLDRIFVLFQRLHKKDQYQGTGIGLSICMKVMKKLGGRIEVESEVGEGTTFNLYFPDPDSYVQESPISIPIPEKKKNTG